MKKKKRKSETWFHCEFEWVIKFLDNSVWTGLRPIRPVLHSPKFLLKIINSLILIVN